ncbi:MAG: MFS transporter [Candidatus Bathyarchaeia archaeon]
MASSGETSNSQGKDRRISLFPILLVNFIGTMGFSIVLPFLVFLVTRFGGDAVIFGVLGAVYPAFQLVGAPILGRWSDTYGRRKILLLSQLGTLAAWGLFLVALFLPITPILEPNSATLGAFMITAPLVFLFLARALDGITGGNISVANAYLADITEEKDRSRNFGKMSMSATLGFVAGPALAGILGATLFGELLPVLAAFFLSLIASVVIAIYLPESKQCIIEKDPEKVNTRKIFGHEIKECYDLADPEKRSFKDIMKTKNMSYMFALYFIMFFGFTVLHTAMPIHAATGLNWTVTDLGILFVVLGLMLAVVQGPILSRASRRFSEGVLIVVGSVVLGTSYVFFLSPNTGVIYLGAAFYAVGTGLMWPSFLSILSKLGGSKHQGSVQGFASSFGSLASIIGLITGGILYGVLGPTTFLVSAVTIYAVFLLSFRILSFEKSLSKRL